MCAPTPSSVSRVILLAAAWAGAAAIDPASGPVTRPAPPAPLSTRPATPRATTAPTAADLASPAWWVRRAVAEAATVPDADRRADLCAGLADYRARAGDRAGVAAADREFGQWAA